MSAVAVPYRTQVSSIDEAWVAKGKFLAHALGFFLGTEFIVSGRLPVPQVPGFTNWLDWPLRILLLWLIVDRNWRIGRLRLEFWDVLVLGFPLLVGLIYPLIVLDPSVPTRFIDYRGFLFDCVRYYTVYLLIREGLNRPGFSARVVLFWVMGFLGISAMVGVAQAFNVPGVRDWTWQNLMNSPLRFLPTDGFRSFGTAPHWNSFASEMIIATIFALTPILTRKLRWFEVGLAALFISALIASTSRGGYLAFLCVVLAAGMYLLANNRRRLGTIVLGSLAVALVVGPMIILTMKVQRFHDFLRPPKVRTEQLASFDYRVERARRLIESGLDRPLTGTGPNMILYNNQRHRFYSAAAVEGVLDVTYPLIFAQFGIIGIAYLALLMGYLLSFGQRKLSRTPYAFAAFLVGVTLLIYSFAEYLIQSQTMLLVSLIAGCAVTYRYPPHARLPEP